MIRNLRNMCYLNCRGGGKFRLGVVLLLLTSLLASCGGRGLLTETEILWDTWGVPHIYADSWEGLFHAFGWAQMHSHGNLILRLYGEARGRAAEYWGEEYLIAGFTKPLNGLGLETVGT